LFLERQAFARDAVDCILITNDRGIRAIRGLGV